ncbi:MAG: hypothetical protein LBU87_02555, partial [Lactobacillales bacterium]|nr:hypothetical protein [Lactobacillales bacterium]
MKKIILLATAAVFWTLPSNIRAATQGTLGLTSIGSVTVTVTINQAMMISNLSDISFSYTPGAGTNQTPSVNVCVYTNTTAGTYYITATSANQSAGTFRVASAAPAYIPYTLQWYTQTGTAGTPTSLTSATKNTTAFTGANTTSST